MKEKEKSRLTVVTAAVLVMSLIAYIFAVTRTYSGETVLQTYANESERGEQYAAFADGILAYSRDGASYISKKGKEHWNCSYQIRNPVVSVKEASAAVADKGGNEIMVFHKKGLKGEIHTTLPIEKIAVSAQGIVSAILKSDTQSRIICYDSAGNILVEQEASPLGVGYPLDLDISDNGYMLLVSYLTIEDGMAAGKTAYYNFGDVGQGRKNYLVTEDVYKGSIIPTVFFMDNNTSAAVADDRLVIYKGKQIPEKSAVIPLKDGIRSVFHDDTFIGVISAGESGGGNIVSLYNREGKQVLSERFEGEYRHSKIEKRRIIMYDGKKCQVITRSGVHSFVGEMESEITGMFPLFGINKYLVINENGLQEIRFAK